MRSPSGTAGTTTTTTTTINRRRSPLAFAVLLVAGACGGGDLLLPSAGEPARIEIVGGNEQAATVGQPLPDSLAVLVKDPEGRPVAGVEVVFVAPAGGLAPNDTVLTGPDGRAAVSYTLPTVAGAQTIEARATPVVPSPSLTTVFSVSATPGALAGLIVAGGDKQEAEVLTALGDSLAVKAVDGYGNGVAGVEVTWQATDGAVSPASVVTGADGRAATQRTLGSRPGIYRTTAVAPALENSSVPFEATGVAPPSPQLVLVTQPSASADAGVPFERQPVLQLQDAVGAPLARADVAVTVQIADGPGSLGGTTSARSNAEGRVRFTDLSIRGRPGDRTLLFAAGDFTPAMSEEIDVNPGPSNAGQSSASVPNGTAGAATTISIRLKDEFGSEIEDAEEEIAISVTGANQLSGLEITDDNDGAYSTSYTPTVSGTDQVDVRVNGEAVLGGPFASVIAPGPASAAATTASVVKTGFFFYNIEILVTTRDAHGNLLNRGGDLVQINVNGGARNPVDNGNGTYSDLFVTLNPSPEIAISVNGAPISGSPFRP